MLMVSLTVKYPSFFLTPSLRDPIISHKKNNKQKYFPQMGEDPLLDIAGLWKFQGFLSLEFSFCSSFFVTLG